ncbi:MAG: hypothetical protein IJO57_00905 [Bacilli bacterium]|nr:hypothetical protein [Bacilli bacterium]
MKKKILGILLSIILMCGLTGCGIKYPKLKKDAIGFQTSSYIDENDNNAGYLTIQYNGRTYMPYGTLKGTLKEKYIEKCIGYIIQNENNSSVIDINNKDTRIYTLSDDKDNNFLMEHYIGTDLMNPQSFYRAIDTRDKDIDIPKYIDDLDYNYWK